MGGLIALTNCYGDFSEYQPITDDYSSMQTSVFVTQLKMLLLWQKLPH